MYPGNKGVIQIQLAEGAISEDYRANNHTQWRLFGEGNTRRCQFPAVDYDRP